MKINISELTQIIRILEERMKEVYPDGVIEVKEDDYYWSVPDDKKYNPSESPDDLSLGQVSFDWDDLQKLRTEAESEGQVAISYHLGCLAEVLNVIKKNGSGTW